MFKEVNKEEAIMAALRRVPVFRLNVDMDPEKVEQLVFQDIRQEFFEDLIDDVDSRFIIDDPEDNARPVVVPVYNTEELARCFEEAEQIEAKAKQTAPKPEQNEAKADQSEPEADHESVLKDFKPLEVKKGKTARKDVDVGKMQALHNAGWSIVKIADEMHVSASVVQRRLAEAARDK